MESVDSGDREDKHAVYHFFQDVWLSEVFFVRLIKHQVLTIRRWIDFFLLIADFTCLLKSAMATSLTDALWSASILTDMNLFEDMDLVIISLSVIACSLTDIA